MQGNGGYFRGDAGTSRVTAQEKKMISKMRQEGLFHQTQVLYDNKIDLSRIKVESLRPWITSRCKELMQGVEDEILIEFICSHLSFERDGLRTEIDQEPLKGEVFQMNLTPFLGSGKKAAVFCKELWEMLLSAMENHGMPKQLIENNERARGERERAVLEIEKAINKEVTGVGDAMVERLKKGPLFGTQYPRSFNKVNQGIGHNGPMSISPHIHPPANTVASAMSHGAHPAASMSMSAHPAALSMSMSAHPAASMSMNAHPAASMNVPPGSAAIHPAAVSHSAVPKAHPAAAMMLPSQGAAGRTSEGRKRSREGRRNKWDDEK